MHDLLHDSCKTRICQYLIQIIRHAFCLRLSYF